MSLLLNKTDEKVLEVERDIYLENVVECNGNQYYISSLFGEEGYETLVFHCESSEGIDNWEPLYVHQYATRDAMERGHSYTCTHIEECLRYWKNWLEGNI